MPNIRPSSDVRNNYQEIAKLAKETRQPIYLTVNGKGDTALIDIAALDELYQRLELFQNIALGLDDLSKGNTLSHEEIFARFRGK